jgi:hypothetical protein
MLMDEVPALRDGDTVELLPGAPVPTLHHHLQPGARGRVVVADTAPEHEPTGWVTVLFGHSGRPVRLHERWLRRISD